ncbi:MAG: hypothetical protein HQQ73_00800 [Desulfobulbaceae bacterium]|nr:hypothetical protein [Desulfobulbaceae bacterium]
MDVQNSNTAPEHLLTVHSHQAEGYKALVDYGAWRVALLNYSSELQVHTLDRMQRHNETDEVFVLLQGRCLLFTGEGSEGVARIYATDMRPGLVYNVRRGVWHTHTLSRDAQVLVVENRDTTYANSPFTSLDTTQRQELIRLHNLAWGL